jgi:bile acid-coenzyme A ligase
VKPALIIGLDEAQRGGRPGLPAEFAIESQDDSPLPDAIAPAWYAVGTGGSTGRPKIVVNDVPGVVGGAVDVTLFAKAYGLGEGTVLVVPGPLYHAGPFGLALIGMLAGSHVVLLEKFDPEQTLAAIERHRANCLFLVPTMMVRIMKLPEETRKRYDLSSLTRMTHAAAPCPAWVKQAWIDWLGPKRVHETFGASDAAGLTEISGDEWLARRGSVGRPVVGEVAIFDDQFKPLPPGEVGEIFMRPPGQVTLRRRYIGAPPPKAREDGGWWSVGDMGWVDADGYLYPADRRVDLIISGGVNIYPAEVEAALEEHPAVACAVVVGLPDDDFGKRVHAIVQTSSPVSETDLRAFLEPRISRVKFPKSFEFTTEMLRDDAGKVRRVALAERAARLKARS